MFHERELHFSGFIRVADGLSAAEGVGGFGKECANQHKGHKNVTN